MRMGTSKQGHRQGRDVYPILCLFFWMDDGPRGSQSPELKAMTATLINFQFTLLLDPHKFLGPDEIHLRILRELADVTEKSLSMIFEQSWEPREVPADWKLKNIVLIFKEGKKKDLRNCKAVSLTPVSGKTMEIIIIMGRPDGLQNFYDFFETQHPCNDDTEEELS
ncbi:hypothetical protein TURU_030465 [Turdus rufiventris]|nr:hypothetical protein TURU_030465 [Turdus rufiventris]